MAGKPDTSTVSNGRSTLYSNTRVVPFATKGNAISGIGFNRHEPSGSGFLIQTAKLQLSCGNNTTDTMNVQLFITMVTITRALVLIK